jgi:hypothetical protein
MEMKKVEEDVEFNALAMYKPMSEEDDDPEESSSAHASEDYSGDKTWICHSRRHKGAETRQRQEEP